MSAERSSAWHDEIPIRRSLFSCDRGRRWRAVAAGSSRAVRCRHGQCDPLGSRVAGYRCDRREAPRWRPTVATYRGLSRGHPGGDRAAGRYHAGRDCRDAAGRPWRRLCSEHDLALSRPSRDDVQKKQRTRTSRSGPTLPGSVRPGSTRSLTSTPSIWSSSMRPPLRRRWLACAAAPDAGCDVDHRSRMAIGRRRRLRARCGYRA